VIREALEGTRKRRSWWQRLNVVEAGDGEGSMNAHSGGGAANGTEICMVWISGCHGIVLVGFIKVLSPSLTAELD
jgi:hypothetical protein